MTFTELVESARVECGVSGSPLLSVQNLSGSLNRIRQWVADSWFELQTERDDWQFMYHYGSFDLTPGLQKYTPAQAGMASFNTWNRDSFWIASPVIGLPDTQPIGVMEWEHFRQMYVRGPQQTQRPMTFAVHPDKSLHFGPIPDLAYHITYEAWSDPVKLVADTDVPNMPEKFHKLIVYMAMGKYATYESANEVMTASNIGIKRLHGRLINSQLTGEFTVDGGL